MYDNHGGLHAFYRGVRRFAVARQDKWVTSHRIRARLVLLAMVAVAALIKTVCNIFNWDRVESAAASAAAIVFLFFLGDIALVWGREKRAKRRLDAMARDGS